MEKTRMKTLGLCTAVALLVLTATNARAVSLGTAGDWGVNITTLLNRSSPAPSTSISDIPRGVLLHYQAATGGAGVGTTTNRYDFETTSTMNGKITFDVDYSAFTGFFNNFTALHVLQNGAEVQTLVPDTAVEPGVTQLFENVMLNLTAGDTWGLRAEAGNFDSGSGVSGNIGVTLVVPEPATGLLCLLAAGALVRRRRRA